mmetsp:Transcript_19063/g.48451  ORF Transcript_19063/g.48451 Transcript_19063/m.48451 type:complete len:145 (-) Transcript_19063:914-1348(-)
MGGSSGGAASKGPAPPDKGFKLATKATQLERRPWLHAAIMDAHNFADCLRTLGQYRPIGLANTLYKLWTRLITLSHCCGGCSGAVEATDLAAPSTRTKPRRSAAGTKTPRSKMQPFDTRWAAWRLQTTCWPSPAVWKTWVYSSP